jgi:AraC-like DNA-binding protein
MMNGYFEYSPPNHLQDMINCYWAYKAAPSVCTNVDKPIIPDGCVDIIFDLTYPKSEKCFVVGAMTKPILNHRTNLIGVRFNPGWASIFLQFPVHEITDLIVDYSEFVGQKASRYSEQFKPLTSTKAQINYLNTIISNCSSNSAYIPSQIANSLLLIQKNNGGCSVQYLSDEVGWSRHHLTRKFQYYTGLSPKFFSQVTRLKAFVKRFKTQKNHDWAQLSLEIGYYDQSHMINEFQKITGLTPEKYLC